jgi:hypothetical protein
MHPRRPLAERTPQPPMPHFETEASFIEGQDVLDFEFGERCAEILF